MAIVLASASPRRKELMEQFCGKDLVIFPAEGEEVVPDKIGPGETVEALARGKAREVAARLRAGMKAGYSASRIPGRKLKLCCEVFPAAHMKFIPELA